MSVFYGIGPKVNQVFYTSSPYSIPNIKAIAQLVFDISCYQDFNVKTKKLGRAITLSEFYRIHP